MATTEVNLDPQDIKAAVRAFAQKNHGAPPNAEVHVAAKEKAVGYGMDERTELVVEVSVSWDTRHDGYGDSGGYKD